MLCWISRARSALVSPSSGRKCRSWPESVTFRAIWGWPALDHPPARRGWRDPRRSPKTLARHGIPTAGNFTELDAALDDPRTDRGDSRRMAWPPAKASSWPSAPSTRPAAPLVTWEDSFGGGGRMQLEDFLAGEEASFIAISGGCTTCPSRGPRITRHATTISGPIPAVWAPRLR